MSFLGKIVEAAVDVALVPVGAIPDAVAVVKGEKPQVIKALIENAGEAIKNAGDDLADGNLI